MPNHKLLDKQVEKRTVSSHIELVESVAFQAHQERNLDILFSDFEWLDEIISQRINEYLNGEPPIDIYTLQINTLEEETTYTKFIQERNGGIVERMFLALTLKSKVEPETLAPLKTKDPETGAPVYPFGGALLSANQRFYPTLKTLLFLLSGSDKKKKTQYTKLLKNHPFIHQEGIITTKIWANSDDHILDQIISIDDAYFDHLYLGEEIRLDQTANFPASLLKTKKTWDDLILNENTKSALAPLKSYVYGMKQYHLLQDKIKPGHIALFHGFPGTGKTLTASLLGKELEIDTYIVNLSQVISKYIGETEKNLDKIFNRLGHTNNILFFDEADALFGKRSEVKEAKDRYANQEVAYLLQRIEKCSCLVILASNFRENMDAAFKRRILTDVEFHVPSEEERTLLWQNGLPEGIRYETPDLPARLANRYSITGANIANILKLICFDLLIQRKEERVITGDLLFPIIHKEYIKENRNVHAPHAWPNF